MDIRRFFGPKTGSDLKSSLQDQRNVPNTPENPGNTPKVKAKKQGKEEISSSSEKSGGKANRCSARRIISSDEESDSEDPVPSKIAKRLGKLTPASLDKKKKAGNVRKLQRLSSDDDSDVEITGTKQAGKPLKKTGKLTPQPPKTKPRKKKAKPPPAKKLNPISAADFFGSAKVKTVGKTTNKNDEKEKPDGKAESSKNDQGKKKNGPSAKKETEHFGKESFDAVLEDIDSKTTGRKSGAKSPSPSKDSSKADKTPEKRSKEIKAKKGRKETERHGDDKFDSLLEDLDGKKNNAIIPDEEASMLIEEYEDSNSGVSDVVGRKRKKSSTPEIVVSDDDEDFGPINAKRHKDEARSLAQKPSSRIPAKKMKSPVCHVVKKGEQTITPKTTPVVYRTVLPTKKSTPTPETRKKTPLEFTSSPVRRSPWKSQSITSSEETNHPSKSNVEEKQVEKFSVPRKTSLDISSLESGTLNDSRTITPGAKDKGDRKSYGGGPGYQNYLTRAGPQALGSKEIPEGAENCLRGKTFVITGVLESIERGEAQALIEKHAGKVTSSVSKKTSFVVVGRDPGMSKLDKIEKFKLKTLDEDALFEMIRKTKPKQKQPEPKRSPVKGAQTSPHDKSSAATTSPQENSSVAVSKPQEKPVESVKSADAAAAKTPGGESRGGLAWVDKYKPAAINQLVGQHGPKSPMNKLCQWLQSWGKWHLGEKVGKKGSIPPWKCDDGSIFKASLLSGPPGIGKTSTAVLVCEHLGLQYELLNASDARNKKSLLEKETIMGGTKRIELFAQKIDSQGAFAGKAAHGPGHHSVKHVLIMDEVDGMSGNQDRSGIAELILLIKKSRIPVICICNDRHSQKIRSLSHHCFDLRFNKPRTEQIRSRVMSIACREGIKLNPQTADQLIEGANHDIRQVVQHLNLLSATHKNTIGFDEARSAAKAAHKDVTVNLFEAAKEALAGGPNASRKSLNEKAELFFVDYSLIPLFVHENYMSVVPHSAKTSLDRMSIISDVAESICVGDQVERMIRASGSWNLLTEQAMYSTVIPSERLNGYMQGQLQFPQWLGKMSTTNRRQRLLNQVQQHSAVKLSGDGTSTVLDYVPYLRQAVTEPLIEGGSEGVRSVLEKYQAYDLTREDVDGILELGLFQGQPDPMSKIEPKVKAAVTREFNKEKHILPYSSEQVAKGRKKKGDEGKKEDIILDEEGNPIHTDDSQELEQDEPEDEARSSAIEAFKKKVPAKRAATGGNKASGGKARPTKKK